MPEPVVVGGPSEWALTADEWKRLVAAFGNDLVYWCADAVREERLHTVMMSRALRVLNPWAILANAQSFVVSRG